MSVQQRPSRFEQGDEVVVMKFGGTSVEDAAAIGRLIGVVRSRLGAQAVVVVSALAKVTDQLLEAGNAAAKGHLGAALATVRDIYVRHEKIADSLVEGSAYSMLDRELRGEFRALESLLHDLDASRQLDLKAQDQLLGFGECFSSRLVKEALCEAGVNAAHVDARTCIVTDGRHGQASPLWDATNQRLQETLSLLLESGAVPVLGGFIAATCDGVPTTLGRGGSDFTAAIVGAALCASRVEIWTDVDGVMTTDPRLCAEARVIRKMSFEEAAELAQFGARVLHPATLAPAMRENIPVYVLNSRRPEGEGTEISARTRIGDSVSAITAKRNVAAVEIDSSHVLDSELLRAVYAAFDRQPCAVEVLAMSPGRIALLVSSTDALPVIAADLRGVANLRWENHKALVSLVGENIRRQPDVASRVFAAVSDMDVRVICQGVSDRTISFLVEEEKVEESVQRLHALLFGKKEAMADWGGVSAAYCQAGLGQAG
jgi:aspartate kinase